MAYSGLPPAARTTAATGSGPAPAGTRPATSSATSPGASRATRSRVTRGRRCRSVMVSLASLWRSVGVEPAVVLGHSQGEIAAAYVAGGLSLDDAAAVVALRSRALAEELSGRGGMVSVSLPSERVARDLERWGERVSLAVINGPASVVVSGEPEALDELLSQYEAEEVRARRIPVDYASHSAQIETIRGRLSRDLSSIAPRSGDIPFYSVTTGTLCDTSGLDGDYWYANLRETVNFYDATRALLESSVTTFIEVSPHPVLTMAVEETVEVQGADPGAVAAIGSLKRDQGSSERFLVSLAQAYVHGVNVDWGSIFDENGATRVALPTYAFQRRRYWLASGAGTTDAGSLGQASAEHPLLGAAVRLAGESDGWLFTGRLALDSHPWLADHAVMGSILMPGTGFVELALAAGQHVGSQVVEELTLQAPLLVAEDVAIQLQITVSEPDPEGHRKLEIYSRPQEEAGDLLVGASTGAEQEWTRHASGVLSAEGQTPRHGLEDLATVREWPPRALKSLTVSSFTIGWRTQVITMVPRSKALAESSGWGRSSSQRLPWKKGARTKHRLSASTQRLPTRRCTPCS